MVGIGLGIVHADDDAIEIVVEKVDLQRLLFAGPEHEDPVAIGAVGAGHDHARQCGARDAQPERLPPAGLQWLGSDDLVGWQRDAAVHRPNLLG